MEIFTDRSVVAPKEGYTEDLGIEMMTTLKIPENRIPVLIGRTGEMKRKIEVATHTKISINDEITIKGEVLNRLDAENIIKAIGRGFAPEKAMELLEEDKVLCIIQLPSNSDIIKARIIGTKGKARRNLERLTKTYISVYGKTASIIGSYENVETAKRAIEKFISGSAHKNVYTFLESRKM